jgi:hypothetical protein
LTAKGSGKAQTLAGKARVPESKKERELFAVCF